jgi:hypothetical protein
MKVEIRYPLPRKEIDALTRKRMEQVEITKQRARDTGIAKLVATVNSGRFDRHAQSEDKHVRKELAVHPATRLRSALAYFLPEARREYEEENEFPEHNMYPYYVRMGVMLREGDLEGALLVLHEMAKKNDAPLIPDSLNINTDYWADVRVIELGCQ